MEDPQQRAAAKILDQQGRRKAQFLTSAILQYIKHPDGPVQSSAPTGVDMAALKQMMLEIMQSDSRFSLSSQAEREDGQNGTGGQALAWDEPASESVLTAMSNTLAAFRRG